MLRWSRHAGWLAPRCTSAISRRSFKTPSKRPVTAAQLLATSNAESRAIPDGCVTLNGFVRSVRKQKRIAFAEVGDGTTLDAVQVVLNPDQAKDLSTGAAVQISGQWQESPSGKEQSHELQADEVKLLGENDAETYPIQKKFQSLEYLRTVPHLRARVPFNSLILRLRSEAIRYATEYFSKQDFVQTHPPIITSSDCEGAGEVFTVVGKSGSRNAASDGEESGGFFKTDKYLTVSSQLHLEALAQAVGKVWALSPTFRAEHSDTPRHLSEFYMLEAEACFVEDVNEIMDTVEGLLRAIVTGLKNSPIGADLLVARAQQPHDKVADPTEIDLKSRWEGILGSSWPRIPYSEAIQVLEEATTSGKRQFEHTPQLGSPLQAEHERYLADTVGRGSPLFVTDYPRDIKAFYMAPSAVEQVLPSVACFDLLVPELCEIAGGSMREHKQDNLLEAMKQHGLLQGSLDSGRATSVVTQEDTATASNPLQWYIDLRKFGSVPHGGFGLGFDRLLCYLSGVSSIRDVASFPRWYGRCDC